MSDIERDERPRPRVLRQPTYKAGLAGVYDHEIDAMERMIDRLEAQLAGTVAALRRLAEIHHGTLVPSKLHEPRNRDWTECECKSCRLAQPFAGQ